MIVAVTGLDREARVVMRPDTITVVGGGDGAALRSRVGDALKSGARRILSIGICGALSPEVQVGDCIVASEVVTPNERFRTHGPWTNEILGVLPKARLGVLAGSNAIVAHRSEKSALHCATNAVATDMESHVAAKVASEHGIPFAAVRVVSDSHRQSLPPAVLVAMARSGKVDVPAVLRSLLSKPGQIPALIRTAWEAEKAFQALFHCRHVLSPGLFPADLRELALDVG
jgi:hopanoid-associated phosphorylase